MAIYRGVEVPTGGTVAATVAEVEALAANTANDVIASANSAAAALVSEGLADADATQTALDVISTNADVVTTNADVVLTNADVVLTHADVVLTNADVVSSGNSASAAAASAATIPTYDNIAGESLNFIRLNAGETAMEFRTPSEVLSDVGAQASDSTLEVGAVQAGRRNLIINGNKTVNQRAYADGVLADGDYGYDRWKGNASDVNIEQVIEASSEDDGTYVISWVGGGTAIVDGTAGLSSGGTIVVSGTGNISVIVPKASTHIQLEKGTLSTGFEYRHVGEEMALCQRYYEVVDAYGVSYDNSGTVVQRSSIHFAVSKRVSPTIIVTQTSGSASGGNSVSTGTSGFFLGFSSTGKGKTWIGSATVDSEI
tara:strand:- start:3631 stop:4740 length:1110 start_codon:yes stop_codon:yes gene_type:complete